MRDKNSKLSGGRQIQGDVTFCWGHGWLPAGETNQLASQHSLASVWHAAWAFKQAE